MLSLEDLRKQKDAAYAERNKCVAGLAALAKGIGWPVGLARHPDTDATWEDDWRNIVWIELPTGQVTWHIHDTELPLFRFLSFLDGRFQWDGHSTEEKYRRLLALGLPPC